jgi:hypothetical protein
MTSAPSFADQFAREHDKQLADMGQAMAKQMGDPFGTETVSDKKALEAWQVTDWSKDPVAMLLAKVPPKEIMNQRHPMRLEVLTRYSPDPQEQVKYAVHLETMAERAAQEGQQP